MFPAPVHAATAVLRFWPSDAPGAKITATAVVVWVEPSGPRTVRLPGVLLLIAPPVTRPDQSLVMGFEALPRKRSETAYQSVSPALSLGSGMPSVLHGTLPSVRLAHAASANPSLSVSGHGSSPSLEEALSS